MSPITPSALRTTGPRGIDTVMAAQVADELLAAITAGREKSYLHELASQVCQLVTRDENDEANEEFGFDRPEESSIVDAIRSAGLKLLNALPKERRHAAAIDIRTLPLMELALKLPELAQEISSLEKKRDNGQSQTRMVHVLDQVSRELRGPVQDIVEELSRLTATDMTLEQRERVENAEDRALDVLHLANDLADLVHLQSGRFATARFEFRIRDCIAAALHTLTPRARAQQVVIQHTVAPDVPTLVSGDPGRVRHVLATLVSNAASSMTGGTLLVSATAAETNEADVLLRITVQSVSSKRHRRSEDDRGAGVWRGSKSSGLGLSIARQLVAQMGGRTWVETTTGGGSGVNFTVRVGIVETSPQASEFASEPSFGATNIVLVEPRSGQAGQVVAMLRKLGATVEVVRTVEATRAALIRFQEAVQPVGVAILCAALDDRIARSVVESVAAIEPELRPPLALVSPNGQRGDATLCRRIGLTAYLTQPVSRSDLRDTLTALLDRELGATIRRRGLLTRHSLREFRGRLHVGLATTDTEQAQATQGLLESIGHRVSTYPVREQLPHLAAEDPPAVMVLTAGGLVDKDLLWLDRVRRRLGLLGSRRVPVLLIGELPAHIDTQSLKRRIDDQLATDVNKDTLSVAIAELASQSKERQLSSISARQRIVDPEALLERLAGDENLVRDVIALFLRNAGALLGAVRSAVEAANGDALVRASNNLRGTFQIFKVRAGIDLCTRLESHGLQEDFSEVGRLVERLEMLSAQLQAELGDEAKARTTGQ
jgi:two-component system, sensor histidine kinase and response regulator